MFTCRESCPGLPHFSLEAGHFCGSLRRSARTCAVLNYLLTQKSLLKRIRISMTTSLVENGYCLRSLGLRRWRKLRWHFLKLNPPMFWRCTLPTCGNCARRSNREDSARRSRYRNRLLPGSSEELRKCISGGPFFGNLPDRRTLRSKDGRRLEKELVRNGTACSEPGSIRADTVPFRQIPLGA